MATIGLDKLYYAKITEGDNGNETYGTPTQLAKAMTAELSVELAEATLYADDGAAEVVKEFQSGTLTLGIDDIGSNDINEVSGGQLQRACICRSMINDPKMIFADEPTGALNRKSSDEVMEYSFLRFVTLRSRAAVRHSLLPVTCR